MRTMVISALLFLAASQPVRAEDARACRLQASAAPAVTASLRAGASFRPRQRIPICPRAARPFTPSCLDVTAVLTQ